MAPQFAPAVVLKKSLRYTSWPMIRSLLYGLAGICLAINIWSNVSTFHQAKGAIETGAQVMHTYKVLHAIDIAKLSIHDLQINRTSVDKAQEDILKVTQLVGTTTKLTALSTEQLLAKKDNVGLTLLEELESTEQALLIDREDRDQTSSVETLNKTMVASFIDLLLLLAIFALFLYDKKMAKKMQNALASALTHVESVNQSLQKNLLKKDSVFKTTVHDLKNPLGSIRGFAELLADETLDNRSALEMTQVIQRISNSTLTLVGTLLNSDDESDQKTYESIQVIDCLKETCAFLEPLARKKDQTIHFEKKFCSFSFWGSRQKIQDVFYNIIGNAIKFSPPGSSLSVSCVDEEEFHSVQIKDQGPGFSKDDFSKMFTPGGKLSARPTAGEDSTGIGLYSVKRTVEKFHGLIEVANNEDRGACVKIKFPSKPPSKSPDLR
jgi:signal transduction histidine kinase